MSVNTVVTVVFVNTILHLERLHLCQHLRPRQGHEDRSTRAAKLYGRDGLHVDWTATFAAVCVTITPLLLALLVLNRAIIYGIQGGATRADPDFTEDRQ